MNFRNVALLVIGILVIGVAALILSNSDHPVTNDDIDSRVQMIDQLIEDNEFTLTEDVELRQTEGAPPLFSFYHREDTLAALVVDVGHETFATEFRYYFDEKGKCIKYVKSIIGRPDNPSDHVLYFNTDRKSVENDFDEPIVSPDSVINLFRQITTMRSEFGGY